MTLLGLLQGDCLSEMKKLEDNSIDAIVTDPPYGLSFMGKKWDYDVPSVEVWKECLRVLKPGGYLLAFAGTRTQHRMACNIEDAGFEIRDMIAWVYGSGFPKSLNIGKAVDKLQGNEREVVGSKKGQGSIPNDRGNWGLKPNEDVIVDKGTSRWEGYGTALKPALEPITVARKPFKGTAAENCLKWGVGGIDIDGSRVSHNEPVKTTNREQRKAGWNPDNCGFDSTNNTVASADPSGRFPANLIHDGSDEVVECFPNDSQRFFYCAKASKKERDRGCEGLEEKPAPYDPETKNGMGLRIERHDEDNPRRISPVKNNHPTVKPIALMKYLVNLVSREGHKVLDPFMGSGTTGIACKELNRDFIGIEMSDEYIKIAKKRIDAAQRNLL